MSDTTATRAHGARRLAAAVTVFVVGVLILFVRFPPDDLSGWIAHTLHVPWGVPVLAAAALFRGAALLLRDTRRFRAFRTISNVMACFALLVGLPLIATFV